MNDRDPLASMLARLSYRRGTFRLASGKTSTYYINSKKILFHSEAASLLGEALSE